jgi:PAS domain S-box-containing protein
VVAGRHELQAFLRDYDALPAMELDARIANHIARGADPTEEQFRLLVASVTEYAIYLLDPAGRVTSWNAGAQRIKGYRAEEIVGRHFSLFYPVEDRAAGKPELALAQAAREGRYEGEGWRVCKDGTRFWAEVLITALRDERAVLKGFAKVTRDMTARHLERERAQLFAATFNHAPNGIAIADASGCYIGANASFLRLIGYSEAELLRKSIFDLTHPDDAAQNRRVFEEIVTGPGERLEFEKRYLRKDGRVIWVHMSLARILDAEGRATTVVAQVEDITARHAAEERLRDSEARLHAFTENSPALMCLKDREGRYRFANAQFLERYGLRREQLIGRSDAEIFPRREALLLSAHDAEVMARGEAVQFEERSRHGDAERMSAVSKFPVFDASGAVAGIGVVASDITDRRLTEQALREQRALLTEAQKIAGLGSWEWDPQSGRLMWSDELYRIYGVSPQSFKPSFETYLECVHAEDRQHSGAMVARALMDGRGFTIQERIVRPGGEVRYLRTQGEVVRSERGKPIKILAACLDVTEQRHSETALRQAAQDLHGLTRRLVQAEEAERRRIARELHDRVGQSLSALNINLDIISRESAVLPEPLQRRLADSLALVDGTLQSIENVMAELRPPLLDEYGLDAALGWHAEEFSQRTGIRASVSDSAAEVAKSLRPVAAVALFRIAQEALNNVAKHAHAKNVRIDISADAGNLVLEVRDDGDGFDAAAAPRGRWGMTTMRERAEAAGGSFELHSKPGAGTAVRACIPL